jgi:hypothetical protein
MPLTEETSYDETTDAGKLTVAAMKRNVIAMANMTMAFTTDGTMVLLYKAMYVYWPSGLSQMLTMADQAAKLSSSCVECLFHKTRGC